MTLEWMPVDHWWWLFCGLLPLLGFIWAPKTWTPGELVSAASMNTNIRDHLNESLRTQATTLTGTQNDFAVDGPFAHLKCNNASALSVTGALVDGGNLDGARLIIEAINATVTLKHQDVGSGSANRFLNDSGGDILLTQFERALAIYDGTNTLWRISRLASLKESLRTQTTTLTGTQNDFAIDGPFSYVQCNNASALSITGGVLNGGNVDGARIIIEAINSGLTLKHQDTGSVAANRFSNDIGADIALGLYERALLIYDGTNSTWRVAKMGSARLAEFTLAVGAGSFNSGTAETDLTGFSFTVPANYLANAGEGFRLYGYGTMATNTNTKTLRLDIAGQKQIIFQTATSISGNRWTFDIGVLLISLATARLGGISTFNAASGAPPTIWHLMANYSGLNWSTAQLLKITGQGGASNDLGMYEMAVAPLRRA